MYLMHLLLNNNKKFELMLMRLTKAYSSSCSQMSVYLQPFHRSSFFECALQPTAAEDSKDQ